SQNGRISTWDAFITGLSDPMSRLASRSGEGLRILTEGVTSPTLADLLDQLLAKYPLSRWHQYEPVSHDNSRAGAKLAFGKFVDAQYRFENADVIVALDSDFLSTLPGNLNYTRKFAARRKIMPGEKAMNRLYVIESTMTITGAMADHRVSVRSSEIARIARAIATGIAEPAWISTLLQDLDEHRGRSIVIAGESQPSEVHAVAHALNDRLGNVGKTVSYTDAVQFNPQSTIDSLGQLTKEMAAGPLDTPSI